MIVVDSSALLAVVLREREKIAFAELIVRHDCVIATPILLESHMALARVANRQLIESLEFLVERPNVEKVAFDVAHLRVARSAFERYGRGSGHPARLNFGDCMSYAIAKAAGAPLLFKGDDFAHTDIEPAWRP